MYPEIENILSNRRQNYWAKKKFLSCKYSIYIEQKLISYRANIHFLPSKYSYIPSKNSFLIERLIRTLNKIYSSHFYYIFITNEYCNAYLQNKVLTILLVF